MRKVRVALDERSYFIKIGHGLLSKAGERIGELAEGGQVAIIAQRKVWGLWGLKLSQSLNAAGISWFVVQVPSGESAKSLTWMKRLYDEFAHRGMDRSSLVAAFGGGAVGDLAGFAAASWLRGVDFVQIPTTLLAQVDASVGGKVAVNLPQGKNLVGAFWQPKEVIIDTDALNTLPPGDLRSGLAEVIKYGIILDAGFYEYIKANRKALLALDSKAIVEAVRRSCELKAYVVKNDERESGLRALLNYGHTIGHAVEAAAGYSKIRHGEAVAIGMTLAARLAVRLEMLDISIAKDIEQTLASFGLPTEVPPKLNAQVMADAMSVDKKVKAGRLRFILPDRIGHADLYGSVTADMAAEVINNSQQISDAQSIRSS